MKGIILLPLIGSLAACGYVSTGVNDYTTVYPTTAGCCNQVVVKPVIVKPIVTRPCCTKVISRPVVANPCCSSGVQTTRYDTLTVVNAEPVDVTSVSYDYY